MEEWNIYEIVGEENPTFRELGMRPQGYLPCPGSLNFSVPGPIWKERVQEVPQTMSPPGVPGFAITDWSKASRVQTEKSFVHLSRDSQKGRLRFHNTLPAGLFATEEMIHPELWKLVAALGPTTRRVGDNTLDRACVPCPFC